MAAYICFMPQCKNASAANAISRRARVAGWAVGGFWGRLRRTIDWRIQTIFAATLAFDVVTGVTLFLGYGLDPSTFFGAAFASWVSGIVFFTLVGAIVAIVSLARPEEGSFDSRARILFKRASGSHIDYIVSQIRRTLEHYAELAENRITILDYDGESGKFRVALESKTRVRSYIDDIESSYSSMMRYTDMTPAPAGGQPNRIAYVRINGVSKGLPETISEQGVTRPIDTEIAPSEICTIETRVEAWIVAGTEEIEHAPSRYTQKMKVTIENHLGSHATTVKVVTGDGEQNSRPLVPGAVHVFLSGKI